MNAPGVILAAGRIVGARFTVKASLGTVGSGRIGRHHAITEPNQEVLLEVIACPERGRQAFASAIEETRRRLADVPTRLVVPFIDHGVEESGLGYVVAPWPSVPPLGELVGVCPLGPTEIVDLGRALSASLAAAHAVGVFHLGLDASCVYVPPLTTGAVLVSGFGLAHAASTAGIEGWEAGGAPELADGASHATRSADVFGAARVLVHAALGSPDRLAAGGAALEDRLPAPMVETLRRALDPDPRARFEDVLAFAEALAEALSGKRLPPRTIPVPSSTRTAVAAPTVPAEPPPMVASTSPFEVSPPGVTSSSGETAFVPPRRSVLPWVGGGLALALAMGVLVVARRPRTGPIASEISPSLPVVVASGEGTASSREIAPPSAPTPPASAPVPPAPPEVETPLGANEALLTVACTPACETVLVDGKPLTPVTAPAKLAPGTYGVGVSAPGYGGQWKKVVLKGGTRQTVPFTLTPAVKAPAQRPKNCGKFLKRCD